MEVNEAKRCIVLAEKLMEDAKCVTSQVSKVILLKEALRLYLMVTYDAVGIRVEGCNTLIEMYSDIFQLTEKHDFGFLKLEGFACMDSNMLETEGVTPADIDWFTKTLEKAAEKVKRYLSWANATVQ